MWIVTDKDGDFWQSFEDKNAAILQLLTLGEEDYMIFYANKKMFIHTTSLAESED